MLQRNHLQPPRPYLPPTPCREAHGRVEAGFVSADDFDRTGVLAGVDPCESRYWWMPELYGPDRIGDGLGQPDQAAWRIESRPTAAA